MSKSVIQELVNLIDQKNALEDMHTFEDNVLLDYHGVQ